MSTEPVRVLLNGLGAVVNLVLVALCAIGAISWDGRQVAAVVAAMQGVCALVAEVIRTQVTPANG